MKNSQTQLSNAPLVNYHASKECVCVRVCTGVSFEGGDQTAAVLLQL